MNSPRSFRTTELVKEFARQGHAVTLLTPFMKEEHSVFSREHGVQIKDLGGPRLRRFSLSGNRVSVFAKRVVNRGLNLFFEYPDIEWMFRVKKALRNEKGYDLMITVAAPHSVHWGAALARRKKNPVAGTWVADCGDPFMGTVLDTFSKLFYFKTLEKLFCRRADFITVPVESAKEGYYPEFREKIRVIPQGFDFNEIDIDPRAYQKSEIPTFAYAGSLIPGGRDPSEFLSYLVSLEREFKFILYTKNRALVEPFLKRAEGRVEVRDYIPRDELLKNLSGMDFLVNFENSTALQQPSKLIDYYLTGRPVLSVGSRNLNTAVVNRFMEGDYNSGLKFDDVDQYRIENVCSRFLELAGRE